MKVYLGIDIGGTNVKAALVSETGAVKAFDSEAWSGGAASDAVELAARLRVSLVESVEVGDPVACGAGSAGLVDAERGVVRLSPNLPQWHDVQLRRMLEDALKLPTHIENDANAAAYGEFAAGAARGTRNAILLTLGTGIGGGLILDGRLYRGRAFAGEVGHMTVDLDGESCLCGNAGCLERLANADAIVRAATSGLAEGRESVLASRADALTARAIGEAAEAGDALALEAVRQTGRFLGAGLANLVLVLAPDVIVIGGGVAAAGEPLLEAARDELRRRAYVTSAFLPPVVPAELGNTAGVVGAALLAREELPAA